MNICRHCHSERKFFWYKKIEVEESSGAKKIFEYITVVRQVMFKTKL